MNDDALPAAEIEALHREFERWFRGRSQSLERVEQALDPEFVFVGTDGSVLSRAEVLGGLNRGRGTKQLAIRVENVVRTWRRGDLLGARYEEWQTDEHITTGRQSTVVFERDDAAPGRLRWISVHETWLTPPPPGR